MFFYKVVEVKQKAKKCGHDEGVERSAQRGAWKSWKKL